MIPTWKTEEKEENLKKWAKMAKNSAILSPEKLQNPTLRIFRRVQVLKHIRIHLE